MPERAIGRIEMPAIASVTVIGLGYIGLPTAAILATNGVRVHGVDVNEATVKAVNLGQVPFVEPDLAGFIGAAVDGGALTAGTTAVPSDVFIIAVPTPPQSIGRTVRRRSARVDWRGELGPGAARA